MGCTCSRSSGEDVAAEYSASLWACCFKRCCFCGMCSVIHPLSVKADDAPSLHNPAVIQSARPLDVASAGLVFPETLLAHPCVQQIDGRGVAAHAAHIDTPQLTETLCGVCATDAEQLKEPNKEKDAFHAIPVLSKKTKDVENLEPDSKSPQEEEEEEEEEDSCPICLEEYDSENPRINTLCEHQFHLSCILEWMERSENCPICDKEMIFNESP